MGPVNWELEEKRNTVVVKLFAYYYNNNNWAQPFNLARHVVNGQQKRLNAADRINNMGYVCLRSNLNQRVSNSPSSNVLIGVQSLDPDPAEVLAFTRNS